MVRLASDVLPVAVWVVDVWLAAPGVVVEVDDVLGVVPAGGVAGAVVLGDGAVDGLVTVAFCLPPAAFCFVVPSMLEMVVFVLVSTWSFDLLVKKPTTERTSR